MAYVLSGNTINDLTVYLTPKGRENMITGKNFNISMFALGDSDVNYLNFKKIPLGHVPDISGDNEGCIKSISNGIEIKHFIDKGEILPPIIFIQPMSNTNIVGNSDFDFKLVFNEKLKKQLLVNFNINVILQTPISSELVKFIEYKNNLYTISEFNELTFTFNVNDEESEIISFIFSEELTDNSVNREVIVNIDLLSSNNYTFDQPLTIRRYNAAISKPEITNVNIINNNGKYNFNVILPNLSYSYPLTYYVFGFPVLTKDIVNTFTHTLTNNDGNGYLSGNYTIIVVDSLGNSANYTVSTPVSLNATLSILSSIQYQIVANINNFNYSLYRKTNGEPILLFTGTSTNSNTVSINSGSPIQTGTYYVVINDGNGSINSNDVTYTSNDILPTISNYGFKASRFFETNQIFVSNITQLGNHTLEWYISTDDINYTFSDSTTDNFINNKIIDGIRIPNTQETNLFIKYVLRTSYGLNSNELIVYYVILPPDVIISPDIIDNNPPITVNPSPKAEETISPSIADISSGCFDFSNLITLENNKSIFIKDIVVGDRLKSYKIDGFTESDDFDIYSKWNDKNITLYNETAIVVSKKIKSINYYYEINGTIKTSYDHTFLIKRNDIFSFKKAKDIVKNDYLVNMNGSTVVVNNIVRINRKLDVVSIDVNNSNLFIINGIITHNKIV